MRVELHPAADAEFAAQIEYYDNKQPGLGLRFYREVIACFNSIAERPELYRMRGTYRRVNLKAFPFYVAYVTEGDVVWVLAVADGRRSPGYWVSRMRRG